MAGAAALGRLAVRRLGSSGRSVLRRTAALPRSTHRKAVAIGKEGDMRRIQEKKEEQYDLMLEAENKYGIKNLGTNCTSHTRLLAQLSAHVTRDDADWRLGQSSDGTSILQFHRGDGLRGVLRRAPRRVDRRGGEGGDLSQLPVPVSRDPSFGRTCQLMQA